MVILGGGFGGVNAAMDLAKLPVDVTIVDRKNYHLFQPLLYQVALAVLSPADIAQPIRSLMRDHPNIDVLMDEAVGFDLPEQRVHLKTGVELEYDYLIIATLVISGTVGLFRGLLRELVAVCTWIVAEPFETPSAAVSGNVMVPFGWREVLPTTLSRL